MGSPVDAVCRAILICSLGCGVACSATSQDVGAGGEVGGRSSGDGDGDGDDDRPPSAELDGVWLDDEGKYVDADGNPVPVDAQGNPVDPEGNPIDLDQIPPADITDPDDPEPPPDRPGRPEPPDVSDLDDGEVRILISNVEGALGKILVVLATRGMTGMDDPSAGICVFPDSDPFTFLAELREVDVNGGNNPCAFGERIALEPGTYQLFVGLIEVGSENPQTCAITTLEIPEAGATAVVIPRLMPCPF